MRKVFLEDLPRLKNGNRIDWDNSVGHKVNFIYDDITGELEIVKRIKDKYKLVLKYLDYDMSTIYIDAMKKAELSSVLRLKIADYRYDVGEIVKTSKGKLEILKQIRIQHGKLSVKAYDYKCVIDGNIGYISEGELIKGTGCTVCVNLKVLIGYNDLWTTHPHIAKLLLNEKDGRKYTYGSGVKVDWRCPNCGETINNKSIVDVVRNDLFCNICSDGISYPEKIMLNVLKQLGIEFEKEKTFDWSKDEKSRRYKRYDFYIPSVNSIIEIHGSQHYGDGFSQISKNTKTLVETQENDCIKKQLALNNNIINYIVIDAKISDLQYIKNNIINSIIGSTYDLSEIDWNKCEEFALSSFVKVTCDLWNNIKNVNNISKIMNLSSCTIRNYLNKGTKVGLCDYDGVEELKKGLKKATENRKTREVICLNTKKVFKSSLEGALKYGACNNSILKCCKNKTSYSGIYNQNYLQWQYYDEYLITPKDVLSNSEIEKHLMYSSVICLNTGEIFKTISKAVNKYKSSNITICCSGKAISAGKHPITNERLQWQYYEEYLIKPKKLLTDDEIFSTHYKGCSKKVICLNTEEVFDSINKATIKYKNSQNIGKCCNNKANYSGIHAETGEPLRWMFYDEYIEKTKKNK